MPTDRSTAEHRTLADYLAVVRRRKWVMILPLLVVPVVAYFYSAQQSARYAATAEVWVSREQVSTAVTGIASPEFNTDPSRFTETQAGLARVPEVVADALKRSGVRGVATGEFVENSSVTPHSNSDLLTFTVEDIAPLRAARLVTAYAHAFSDYRLHLATASLATARADLEANLRKLDRRGLTDTALYRQLEERAHELRTLELLQTRPAVVQEAVDAEQIAPTPRRSAMLGLAFGLLLGIAAAFLWDALDRRVRDEAEVEDALGIPLLARLSTAHRDGLIMLDKPSSVEAESVRRLRTGLEFANLDLGAKVVMVTSAVASEGKSLAVANLALALARSGRKVGLVDLDLRRPSVGRLFDTGFSHGLTDVALGRVALDDALVAIPLVESESRAVSPLRATRGEELGELFVLTAGAVPSNPGELLGTNVVREVLSDLRERMDYVLVDAPPMLAVSDASILSSLVDAILVVVRLGQVNRPSLRELARELDASLAPKLGFITTGSSPHEFYGAYGYGSADATEGTTRVRQLAPARSSTAPPASKVLGEEHEGRRWA